MCVPEGIAVVTSSPRTTSTPSSSPAETASEQAAMVSWSVTHSTEMPAEAAARTRSEGDTIPSLDSVCACTSAALKPGPSAMRPSVNSTHHGHAPYPTLRLRGS